MLSLKKHLLNVGSKGRRKSCQQNISKEKPKKTSRLSSDSKFITKKLIAIAVSEVLANLVITQSKPKRRLACPNLPSMDCES
jgi:hypothetical protein